MATSAPELMFDIEFTDAFQEPKAEEAQRESRVVMGRLRKVNGEPKVGVLVTLLDESKKSLESVKTDNEGMFHFEKLPPEQSVMTRIEEDDTDLMVDIFLLDEKGNISSRATRIGERLYGFGANENGFNDLRLLSEKDWTMNVTAGKHGVTGKVVDTKTFLFGQANLEVGLYNLAKKKMATTNTDKNGRFEFRDVDKGDYTVRVEGDRTGKYSEMVVVDELNVPFLFANSNNVGADGFFEFKKLPADVVEMKRMEVRDSQMQVPSDFTKMEEGKTIVLKNILFSSGSANLLESSYTELDKLASELKKQTTVRIEISGHTDNTGNSKTNQTLSENRAKAVKDYLVSKGIDTNRMTHKGFGDSKPIASNDTEDGKHQNRRVEFVVIK
ncbi:MAG: OmpA family protein [Flavobacteriales bacterium]